MTWLATQMWLLLAAAFALGLALGWWVWSGDRRRADAPNAAAEPPGDSFTATHGLRRPLLYPEKPEGPVDDLTVIIGVDEACAQRLNTIGVYYLRQLAEWGPARAAWVEHKLGEPGRIDREQWIEQARSLQN